jgi:hypothetical protein
MYVLVGTFQNATTREKKKSVFKTRGPSLNPFVVTFQNKTNSSTMSQMKLASLTPEEEIEKQVHMFKVLFLFFFCPVIVRC